jgi:hypothetical protein
VHQDRPHHGLDLSILRDAVLIPKSDCQNNTARDETQRPVAHRAKFCGPKWLLAERDQMASLIDGPNHPF